MSVYRPPRPENPCGRACPDRTSTCKLNCEKWAEYEVAYKEYEDKKYKEVEKANMLLEARNGSFKRWHVNHR